MILRISSNLSELMSGMSSKANEATRKNWAEFVQRKDQERSVANHSQGPIMFDLPDDQWKVTHEHHSIPAE